MKIKIILTLTYLLTVLNATSGNWYDRTKLNDNELIISNKKIERKYEIVNGYLISKYILNKVNNTTILNPKSKPENPLGIKSKYLKHELYSNFVEATNVENEHYEVIAHLYYEDYELKRVFSVYENSASIRSEIFIKAKKNLKFNYKKTELDYINFRRCHYNATATEFFDRTDGNNNLVHESKLLSFNYSKHAIGNVFRVKDNMESNHFFLIKEAPCSFVQLAYPSYDFIYSSKSISIKGLGVKPADLKVGEWIKTYGSIIGVYDGTDYGFLTAMKQQRKTVRKYVESRDEMVMMNTWGDRNKDASIGEEFLKREILACEKYGISHFQVDDGWQSGLAMNTAAKTSKKMWDMWDTEAWEPNKERFPNGFKPVSEFAEKHGVKLGLWFHPSNENDYGTWERDAKIVAGLYKKYNVGYFKIDGIKLPTKQAEINLKKFFDKALELTNNKISFNVDATADNRLGYFYFNKYGNIFLENRYSDHAKYYPYWTLRNLWMLSKYIRPENLQIEFLNIWRKKSVYPKHDLFAPHHMSFDYCFATCMAGQPLAWFEGSNLPKYAEPTAKLIKKYRKIQSDFHTGNIVPIGNEPNGATWTGFQSIKSDKNGYLLIYRERNELNFAKLKLFVKNGKKLKLTPVLGEAVEQILPIDSETRVEFKLKNINSFCMYRYEILE
jgi:hypothetical protein